MAKIIAQKGVKVKIHAFLDGRDTDPFSGKNYLRTLLEEIDSSYVKLVSIIGRYYAMDRDNRWERIAKAYHLIVHGKGEKSYDMVQSVENQYAENVTDEFMIPIINADSDETDLIKDDDVVLFCNFRTDRPRQLTAALCQEDHHEENMAKLNLHFFTMTKYNKNFKGIKVLFEKDDLVNTLGEVVSKAGRTQVRIAETEKYPHVTFFFSGGREKEFAGESRILVNSPKVATYDLQPEMSAVEVTEKLVKFIEENTPDFICINYANTDMVGHTGIMEAAMKAASTVDACLKSLVSTLEKHHYTYIIIADHGNADIMINPDGSPNTAHTTNPVPMFLGGNGVHIKTRLNPGKLGDIAPTILTIMGIDVPSEMEGNVLIQK